MFNDNIDLIKSLDTSLMASYVSLSLRLLILLLEII